VSEWVQNVAITAQSAEIKPPPPARPTGRGTEIVDPALAMAAMAEATAASAAAAGATATPARNQVPLAVAIVGAVVVAGVSFAVGWKLGQNQARDYFGKAAAHQLQPVREVGAGEETAPPPEGAPHEGAAPPPGEAAPAPEPAPVSP
jgi:hypothetical protein